MHLPGPRFHRTVTLVVIDAHERVALFPLFDSVHKHWALPHAPVRLVESYTEAALRLGTRCFSGSAIRWGPVVGRRWATVPSSSEPRVRMEEHVFLTRARAPLASNSTHGGGRSGPAVVWAARAMLSSLLQEPHLDSTATLIDGYLDGWLPDGPITLD